MDAVFVESVGAIMRRAMLAFGHLSDCDGRSTVSPEHGHTLGHAQVLDIDGHHVGEPIFNCWRLRATLIDRACVYADVTMPEEERLGLKCMLQLSRPREKYKLPSPTLRPWNTSGKNIFHGKR